MAAISRGAISKGAFEMRILVVIASWTLGSIVLGLFWGRFFGMSAKRGRAEKQFIASLQTGSNKTTRPKCEPG
jgi:hypothetical protein